MKKRKHPVRRLLWTNVIIGLAIVTGGCSLSISFNIKNLSGQAITIHYTLKEFHNGGLSPYLITGKESTKKVPIPEDRISIDTENRVVEFKLLPDENVQLFWVGERLDKNYEEVFNIANLRITGEDGSRTLEGRQVFENFRPIKRSWYEFGPEIAGFVLEYY